MENLLEQIHEFPEIHGSCKFCETFLKSHELVILTVLIILVVTVLKNFPLNLLSRECLILYLDTLYLKKSSQLNPFQNIRKLEVLKSFV